MKLLKYKNYLGDVQISEEDNILYGKLQYISALISYEGKTVETLRQAFEEAVDDYLETCKIQGYQPEIPCKGSFDIRIGHDLHLATMIKARKLGMSLNEFVKTSINKNLMLHS